KLEQVWINGKPYDNFDAEDLTVKLPSSDTDLRVQVRIAPTRAAATFFADQEVTNGVAKVTMSGNLEARSAYAFKSELDKAIAQNPRRMVLMMSDLYSIAPEGVRVVIFCSEHLGVDVDIYGVGASEQVQQAFKDLDLWEDM